MLNERRHAGIRRLLDVDSLILAFKTKFTLDTPKFGKWEDMEDVITFKGFVEEFEAPLLNWLIEL